MKFLNFIFALIFPLALIAQRNLPHYPAEIELQLLPTNKIVPGEALLAPPPVPVRTMAEWEEVERIIISWSTSVSEYKLTLSGIIAAAQKECMVTICVKDSPGVVEVKNFLQEQSIDLNKNIEIKVVPNNSIWVRDYGPNSVYANGVDSLLFIDWIYNRPWRPLDNDFSFPLAKSLSTSVYTTFEVPEDLVNTGGNFMTDGLGTAFSSTLVLDENSVNNQYNVTSKSEKEVNEIMKRYMGIDRYIKMKTLPYDGIHHIDMHMKLLDEETLLIGQYPAGKSDGPQIEANIQYVLSNYKSVYGTPYKVVRIPMPSFSGAYPPYSSNKHLYPTYANALIVNKTVIMPSYKKASDQAAIDTFKRYMPGYNIIPVYCREIVEDGGAVHCITKEVGVREPLQMVHQPLQCQNNAEEGYAINALINHKSGVSKSKVWYTTDLNKPWQSVAMTALGGHSLYNYQGIIPKQAEGTEIYYYIESEAFSGKKLTRPITAPQGYWNFCVKTKVSSDAPSSAELLDIFPNPAANITAIPVVATQNTMAQIALYDALGRLVEIIHDGELSAGKQHFFIDASQYTGGTYFVSFRTHNQLTMKHLMIR